MHDTTADLARANLYRYLSVACLRPDDDRFDLLRDPMFESVVTAAIEWIRSDPAFRPERLGPGELDPHDIDPAPLFDLNDGILGDYLDVFGHSISKECPPYENEYYANRDITFRSQRLADTAGFYRAFGLDRAATARDRVDHLSFQAEFQQILIARLLYAAEEALGNARLKVCRHTQRRFFAEHLGWWLPAFGIRLENSAEAPFYKGLGRFVRGLVAAERAVLGLPPFTELPTARPDAYEPEGSCFGCSLNSDRETAQSTGGPSPPEMPRSTP